MINDESSWLSWNGDENGLVKIGFGFMENMGEEVEIDDGTVELM